MLDEQPRNVSTDGRYVCTYTDPYEVMRSIRIIDMDDVNQEIQKPSDFGYPSYDDLCKRICVAETMVDKYTGQSWRPNRKTEVLSINSYWHDNNSPFRSEYYRRGGYFIQLRHDVLPWNPYKGDRLEFRTNENQWVDMTHAVTNEEHEADEKERQNSLGIWMDHENGLMFIRRRFFQPLDNSVRITYRYGREGEDVPADISRATELMVAKTILNEEVYLTKIGTGGDLGSNKSALLKAMDDEISMIVNANKRYGAVYSFP